VKGVQQNQGLLRAQIRRAIDHQKEWAPFQALGQVIVEGMIALLARFPEVGRDQQWRRHVRIAMQMIFGTLNNVLINRSGPLVLADDTTDHELSRAAIRYLGW
jgi:hypothetical protein